LLNSSLWTEPEIRLGRDSDRNILLAKDLNIVANSFGNTSRDAIAA
jgi:hypothetical protein